MGLNKSFKDVLVPISSRAWYWKCIRPYVGNLIVREGSAIVSGTLRNFDLAVFLKQKT